MSTQYDPLLLILVDKGALALLIVLTGYWASRLIERFKAQQARETAAEGLRHVRRLEYLDKQLSEFYWPLYVLLRTDQAVFEHMQKLASSGDAANMATALRIEDQFIRHNREAIIKIIQSKIHLMEGDTPTFRDMLSFVRDVAATSAIQAATEAPSRTKLVCPPTPALLIDQITKHAYQLQTRYDSLVEDKMERVV